MMFMNMMQEKYFDLRAKSNSKFEKLVNEELHNLYSFYYDDKIKENTVEKKHTQDLLNAYKF
jgi:hypothetical protein